MKQSRKGMLMAALICGTIVPALFGGTSVFAEEAKKEAEDVALQAFELNPMVVTAQRMETKDLDTPATTTVITKEEMERTGATTVVEALRRVPGITDGSYSASGDDLGSSPSRMYLRGFDKGTLVLVNGAPININNYGSPNSIPVNAVERIEVVKGSNSVLYGAEALGGVVNIITKKGEGKLSATVSGTVGNYLKKYSATIQGDGYIASFGKDYVHEFDHSQKELEVTTASSKDKGRHYYRTNNKYQRTTAFTSFALGKNLQLNWNYAKIDPSYINRFTDDNKQYSSSYHYKDTRNTLSLVYDDKKNNIKSILAYNSKKVDSTSYSDKGKPDKSQSSNYKVSNIYFDTQKKWDFGKADSLIFGITVKHEKYDQAFENEYGNEYDNARNSYGAYLSYNKHFNDRLSATLGLRGQTYRHSDADVNNYNVFLPQLQTLYKVNDNVSWYTNIGKAFEMPAMNAHVPAGGSKAAGTAGAMMTMEQIREQSRNGSVKPEEGWNYETGIKRITDTSSTKLAVFYMDYKNKFDWVEVTPGIANPKRQVNKGKFKNFGVELEYQKKLSDKWEYNLGVTLQNPKSKNEDLNLWDQDSARIQFTAGVNYKLNKFTSNLNLLVLADREPSYYRSDYLTASSGRRPDIDLKDRFLLNASFIYRPTDRQSVALNLYNILDRRDESVFRYEYRALPFNWTLTYNYTF